MGVLKHLRKEIMENNKISFFKRAFLSITDFDSYQRFAFEKTKVAFVYILILASIVSAVLSASLLYKLNFDEEFILEVESLNSGLDMFSDETIRLTQDMINENKVAYCITLFIVSIGAILLDGLIMAALGYAMSKLYMIKIGFTSILNIALHALTLSLTLNLIYIIVNMLTAFTIKYFNMIYTSVTCVYVITAILLIRSNMIRQQIAIENVLQQINPEDEIFREEHPDKKKEKEEKKDKKDKEKDNKENGEAKEGGLA